MRGIISGMTGGSRVEGGSDMMSMAREASGMQENKSCFPTMSYEKRFQGFVALFVMGWILSIVGVVAISFGNITGFVILYTFGNVIALCSTFFLMGPWRQLKSMCDRVRIIATLVFVGMMVATLVVGLTTNNLAGVIVCAVCQFFAGLWYSLSYIPFARSMVCSCLKSSVGRDGGGGGGGGGGVSVI